MIVQKSDPDVLVLRLVSLESGRAEEIRGKLAEAEKQGLHKVILDLRECNRGPVSEAIATARLFIPSGTLATLRGQTVSTQNFAAEQGKVAWSSPVSVLIDGTTAGAAEVLASAIAANHRGDLVGERTFGLASEQKLIPLDDGGALILTVANYLNPSGKSILEDGVEPSQAVRASASEEESDASDDSGATPREPGTERPLTLDDPIFHKALDLLKAPAKKAA
jgi:carboxyl-terminal processing protease